MFNIKKDKRGEINGILTGGVTALIGILVIFVILMLAGSLSQKIGERATTTSVVVNETFTPGTDASGNAWVNLGYNDIINGSEVVQNNVAGNNSYRVSAVQYNLDVVLGRINVTNLSAYNFNLNITYTRNVASNASINSARAINNASNLMPNVGTVFILGIILTIIVVVGYGWMRRK